MEPRRPNPVLVKWRGPLAWAGAIVLHALLLMYATLYEPAPKRIKKVRPPYYTPPILVEIREGPRPPPPSPTQENEDLATSIAEESVGSGTTENVPQRRPVDTDEAVASIPFGRESGAALPDGGAGTPAPARVGPERSAAPLVIDIFDPEALRQTVDRWNASRRSDTVERRGHLPGPGGEGDGLGEGDGEGDGTGADTEARIIAGRINADLAHARAVSRVRAGLVDPYFRSLGTEMENEWAPRRLGSNVERDALGPFGDFLASWQSAGKTWASSGSAFDSPPPREHRVARPVERDGSGLSDFAWEEFAFRWNNGEFSFPSGHVLLQLTQAPNGDPVDVRIVSSSGSDELDASAVQAVTRVAQRHTPPHLGLGLGGSRIRTLWKLEALLLPRSLSLPFDETGRLGPVDANASIGEVRQGEAGDRVLRTRIELVAIYGGLTTPLTPATSHTP